jgi:hypothetical protein
MAGNSLLQINAVNRIFRKWGVAAPYVISVLNRLAEYRAIGDSLVLQRYASGRRAKANYFIV